MSRGRRSGALTCALLAALAVAAQARASTVTFAGDTVTFTAAAGEANKVQVTREASACGTLAPPCTQIQDANPITSIPMECAYASASPDAVVCPLVPKIDASLGDGDDQYSAWGFDSTVSGGDGNDLIYGGDGNDRLDGGAGNDFVSGGPGNDLVSGGPGNDQLENISSSLTTLPASTGTDLLSGGDGFDTLVYDGRTDDLSVSLDGVANDGAPDEHDNVGKDIEQVVTGSGNDTIDGNAHDNVLSGGAGDDTIYGEAGNDVIDGGPGTDTLYGDNGRDTVDGGPGNDVVDGGLGADTLLGDGRCAARRCSGGDDEIFAQDGFVDLVDCGPGADSAHVDFEDVLFSDPASRCESLDRAPKLECVVPRVIGMPLAAARAEITLDFCTVGKITRRRSRGKRGRVISQRPAPGKHLPAGARVRLVVSRG